MYRELKQMGSDRGLFQILIIYPREGMEKLEPSVKITDSYIKIRTGYLHNINHANLHCVSCSVPYSEMYEKLL